LPLKIVLLDDYQNVALKMAPWSSLPNATVAAYPDHLGDEAALAERLQDADVVMALRERTAFPRSLLERLPKLKLIPTAGMRNAAIDEQAATELGILICGTSGDSKATCELTWGLIFALLRHIPHEVNELRAGRWQTRFGTGLAGKTLGLLGLGNIGSQMARVGRAFDMTVIAWSQNLTAEKAQAQGAELVTKEALLRRSDVLSIHTRLSDRTRGIIGAAELAAMKPASVLINSSRGPIVDEAALVAALRKRTIAGAALDVFDEEPVPQQHPLLGLDNVVCTPHLGYVTEERLRVFYQQTLENIAAWLKDAPLRVVNPGALPHRRRP
jgi:phosphoglycerate dehydrogenase-like enzyme